MAKAEFLAGILGCVLSALSIIYAIYNTYKFSKGISIGALKHIRMLINRMEESKKTVSDDARATMHHTQQDLEVLFKNLQNIFKIPDKKAPL